MAIAPVDRYARPADDGTESEELCSKLSFLSLSCAEKEEDCPQPRGSYAMPSSWKPTLYSVSGYNFVLTKPH